MYSLSNELWYFVSFKEHISFIQVIKFIGKKLFIILSYYLFNVCRIYNDVFAFILDIGNLCLCSLFFFPWWIWLQFCQFHWSSQRIQLVVSWFSLLFIFFYFIDLCSYLYYFLSFVYFSFNFSSVSSFWRWKLRSLTWDLSSF